jgi:hypothetical protein
LHDEKFLSMFLIGLVNNFLTGGLPGLACVPALGLSFQDAA